MCPRAACGSIIDNLERDGEHYAKCSLSFGLGESEPLFARLREHLPQDEPPPKQPRTE